MDTMLNSFVPDVHFEKIPIKNLVSNQDYQRNLSQAHIARAAANFDLYQINPVKVSRRDGVNYVFNGQHTIEIVALVSGSRETPVWCMIYDDLCYEHEADIFANQQKFVKSLSPYEVFVANLEAGNDQQLIIRDLVESYGLKLGYKKAAGEICAISTIENIFSKYGYHVLDHVLRLCIATWEGEVNSFSANILNALAKLIMVYGDDLDDENFKTKLGAISVKQLIRNAKERRQGMMGVAEVMVIEYNGRKKNSSAYRLQLKRLYEMPKSEDDAFPIDLFPDSDEPSEEEQEDDMPYDDSPSEEQV